jgi:hypothetical protein
VAREANFVVGVTNRGLLGRLARHHPEAEVEPVIKRNARDLPVTVRGRAFAQAPFGVAARFLVARLSARRWVIY